MWIVPRQNSILGEWHINSTYVKILDKKAIETGELLLPLHRPSHQIIYRRYISAGPFAPLRPKSTQLPAVDAHSGFAGFRIHVASGNFTYFIASATEHHGPHDAIAWTPENKCIMIQASSMWGFSVEEFVGLLSQLQNDKIRLGDVGCLGR